MSISVWDKPAELNINPIPWEFILKAGMSKDKMYQDTLDEIKPYEDLLLKRKALPGDDTSYLQNAQNGLKNLVNSTVGVKDLTDPLEAKKFLDQARQIGLDPKLIRNENALTYHEEQMKKKAEYKDKEHGIYDSQDYAYSKALKDYTTPGSGGGDKYNLQKYSIGPVGTDVENARKQFFDQMPELKFDDHKQAGDYWYKATTEGISQDRIDQRAMDVIGNYASSYAGRQELSDYQMLTETNPNALAIKDSKTKQVRVMSPSEYLYKKLATTGMERAGLSYTSNIDDALNLGIGDQKDNPYLSGMTESTQFDPYMNVVSPFGDIKDSDLEWTENGNPQIINAYAAYPKDMPETLKMYKISQNEKIPQDKAFNIIRQAEIFRSNDPNLKGRSIKEIYTLMNEAQKNASASFNAITYPKLDNEQVAGRILANLAGKNLHLVSSAGEGGNFDIAGIAEKLGNITPVQLQEAIQKKASSGGAKFVPLNASGKPGYLVQVVSDAGKTADIIVPISNEANAVFGKFNYAFDAYKNGKTGINKDAVIVPGDEGVYTGLQTHVDPNDPTKLIPEWVVGRVQSMKETKEFLATANDGKPITMEQAKQAGVSFTPDGRLVVKDIPELLKETSDQFMNSTYMKGYFTKPNNTATFK